MKKLTLVFTIIFLFLYAGRTQGISINQNNTPPDASAMLDVSSTSKGILIPRMRTNERISINSPANGLMVYDIDTRSFWYCEGGNWREILNSTYSFTPTGLASGDLYGTYPSPNVGKIQNLDVAFGVPSDKQIMKWDMLNNRWQGLNDSLFLPYNVTYGNPAKLFGITNSNTVNGATAVYGKIGAGSGIAPVLSIGVWGDNANGAGMLGTSNNGTGVYGYSVNNYGVYGYTADINHAGVYGSNVNAGTGVFGEVYSGGTGIMGKSNGTIGKAASFRNYHVSNNDTAVMIQHDGLGRGVYIGLNNSSNTTEALSINNVGIGQTINIASNNPSNSSTLINANYNGTGYGLFVYSSNTSNTLPAIAAQQLGPGSGIESYAYKGKAGLFRIPSTVSSSTAFQASTLGTGSAAEFAITNATNNNPVVEITTTGTGRGLNVSLSNVSNLAAAIHASSPGNKAIEGFAQGIAITGQTTGLTGGIGVLGQSSLNSADGIGIKAMSYSTSVNNTSAALVGINNSDGTAIYADATGGGVAVWGKASRVNGASIYASNDASQGQALRGNATGTDGISMYAESGNANSQSIAGYFRNNYSSNSRNVVQIITNGTGKGLSIQNTNASNNNEMLRIQNAGTAEFLLLVDASLDTKMSVAKDGAILTDGTVTVKGNKGIVRNSTGLQLRTEIMTVNIPSGSIGHYNEFNGLIDVNVTFSTAFASAPMITLGNMTTGSIAGLTALAINVTNTGFTLRLVNYSSYDFTIGASSMKVLAIGAE